jgi:glycosyltransferase involved in cell wall biosynthesis
MIDGSVIAVVVPAYREAERLSEVVRTMPRFVDRVVVVDDASDDGTKENLARDQRLDVIVHRENRGVGAAIASGYRRALELGADVVAVMAGDGQMDPDDLEALLAPVLRGTAEYAKGNRLAHSRRHHSRQPVRLHGDLCSRTVAAPPRSPLSTLRLSERPHRYARGARHAHRGNPGASRLSR